MSSFRERPIVLETLPHTGRPDGDDTGYRDVALSDDDAQNPDPMVAISYSDHGIRFQSVYASAPVHRVYPFPFVELGATRQIFMRLPAIQAIRDENKLLKDERRERLVIDGFRPASVQQKMWALIYSRIAPPDQYQMMTIYEKIRAGNQTEVIGAHVAVVQNSAFDEAVSSLLISPAREQFAIAASGIGIPIREAVERYLVYEANLGHNNFTFDLSAPTAHGNGGPDDSWLINTNRGEVTCYGVHYDYTGHACRLDFFENPDNLGPFQEEVAKNEILRTFLAKCGFPQIDVDAFNTFRGERRISFWANKLTGGTTYGKECWHNNRDNTRGGNQSQILPGSGNSCQALLKNVCDPGSGKPTACWTNAVAHRLVEQLSQ